MIPFDINEARRIKTEKAIKRNYQQYKKWVEDNEGKILRTAEGHAYGPESFEEFKSAWKSLEGSHKLDKIKYFSQYKTSYKTAMSMKKKASEAGEKVTLEEAKKLSTYQFKDKYLKEAIADFDKIKKAEIEAEYTAELGLPSGSILGAAGRAEVNRRLKAAVTFEFFGGS